MMGIGCRSWVVSTARPMLVSCIPHNRWMEGDGRHGDTASQDGVLIVVPRAPSPTTELVSEEMASSVVISCDTHCDEAAGSSCLRVACPEGFQTPLITEAVKIFCFVRCFLFRKI